MNGQQRILVIDNEPQVVRALRRGLGSDGYVVQAVSDGNEALMAFKEWRPDLVITDIAIPNRDGLELCHSLRSISSIPILVLSATSDEHIKVEAFDLGADDYMTKPFSMDELRARVRAALRRPQLGTGEVRSIEIGDFRLNLETRSVKVRGEEVHLTPKEYELLVYFVRHAGKVHSHSELLEAVWGSNYAEQTEYLRVFIGHLRKKIEPDPTKPQHILTVPWVGYRFDTGA